VKESTLVAFTLAGQAAAGTYAILAVLQLAIGAATPFDWRTLAVLSLLVLLGMAASLGHLGVPSQAYRALCGLRTSWLSREILAAALFAGSLALQTGVALLWGAARFPAALTFVVALLGLSVVYCMARAYMLRTMQAWDTPAVLLSFAATALVLGGLLALVLAPGAGSGVVWLVAAAALVDIALGLWRLRPVPSPVYGGLRAPARPSPGLQAAHVGLLVLAVAWALCAGDRSPLPGLALAVAAEVANRVRFYRI